MTLHAVKQVRSAPLSSAQRRLWFLDRMDPGKPIYNVPYATRLSGPLDALALARAVQAVVDRHEALRTLFPERDGVPEQRILPHLAVPLPVVELSHVADGEREAEVARRIRAEAARAFDLAEGPLVRAVLLQLSPDEHVFLLTVHHIVFDAWSQSVFVRELAQAYGAFARGEAPLFPTTPIGYTEAVRRQEEEVSGEGREAALAWWRAQLGGAPALLTLPTDRPRPPTQSYRGASEPFAVPRPLVAALEALARRERVSLFMTLLAGLATVLSRWSGQEDLAVGVPVAGRNTAAAEDVVGLFVNTLVLRCDLSGDPTFRELLARVRETALSAYEHQDLPLERLVEVLAPERTLAHAPLFQVMLALQNIRGLAFALPGVAAEPIRPDTGTSRFDLTFFLDEGSGGLGGSLEYATDLFDRATAARLARQLLRVLSRMAEAPDEKAFAAPLLSEAEREEILFDWNRAPAPHAGPLVPELVARRLEEDPRAVVATGAGRRRTARDLDRRSERIARRLRALGAGRDVPVAVALPRTVEMVDALLGVLRSGAAYLPLDPAYPEERLRYMLEDSGAPILLTDRALAARLPRGNARTLLLDDDSPADGSPLPRPAPDDLAYLLYTSGSTGRPKGVEVTHRGLANVVDHFAHVLSPGERDLLLSVTTLSFDIASLEVWLPLVTGARLAIATREEARDGAALSELLHRSGATLFQATPTTYRLLLEAGWGGSSEITLLCGGEIVPRDLADALLPRCRALWNGYGPTETTIYSALDRVQAGEPSVPIGRPVAGTRLHVLDARRAPVPVGVLGEIYIGGAGLARGYRGRADLTAERFVPDPFSGEPGALLYRTGDLARYLPDGRVDVVGRVDQQVKLRGFRIELGEIETALASHADVAGCAVAVKGEGAHRRLVAYVVPAGGSRPEPARLREHLARLLPDFMLPSSTVLLDALPMTPNRKVDRGALPEPEAAVSGAPSRAAADATEEKVLALFREVLASPNVSPEDDFFASGGHSLLAARLFALLERAFGRKLPLATVFAAPTPAALARVLRGPGEGREEWSLLVPIQANGTKVPLFCVHAIGGNVLTYADLARRLGPDQPVYGLQARGLSGREAPHASVEEMAAAYVKEIRALRSEGPYHLAGSSFGGTVAYEMARQLRAAGAEVGVLALFDTWGPDYGRRIPGMTPFRLKLASLRERVDLHAGNFLVARGLRGKASYVLTKGRRVLHNARKNARRFAKKIDRLLHPLPKELREVEAKGRSAMSAYVPGPFDGRVTLFRASRQPAGIVPDPSLGWARVARGGLEVHEIPGYHGAIVYEPRAGQLADKLAECLAASGDAGASDAPAREAAPLRPSLHLLSSARRVAGAESNEAAR